MNLNPIVLSIPIYFLLIGVELLIQHFQHRKIYRLNDALTNISCGITQQVSNAFFTVLSITVYEVIYEHWAIFHIPNTWYTFLPIWLAVDFCYYWAHRKSHEVNLFWGGHVVHHQSEDYNFSVALRQSTFQIFWTFFFYFPLAIIGVDTMTFVFIAAINTVYQFWIHTETIGKLGWLEYIFNTPSHHRVHHGRDPKYIDKNHAGTFIIWDRLFGTFQVEEERPTYGITTPVNSWNPIRANLQHYINMAAAVRKARTFGDRLKIIFKKPGWFPAYMGGYQAPQKVDKSSYQKYNIHPPASFTWYLLLHYVLILLGTSFFMFNQSSFPLTQKLIIATGIIWSVVNLGGLIEMQRWAFTLEVVRLILLPVIFHLFIGNLTLEAALALIAFISIWWVLNHRVVAKADKEKVVNAG